MCSAAPLVTALRSLHWPLLKWNIKCLNRNIKVSIYLLGNEVFLPKVTPEGQGCRTCESAGWSPQPVGSSDRATARQCPGTIHQRAPPAPPGTERPNPRHCPARQSLHRAGNLSLFGAHTNLGAATCAAPPHGHSSGATALRCGNEHTH